MAGTAAHAAAAAAAPFAGGDDDLPPLIGSDDQGCGDDDLPPLVAADDGSDDDLPPLVGADDGGDDDLPPLVGAHEGQPDSCGAGGGSATGSGRAEAGASTAGQPDAGEVADAGDKGNDNGDVGDADEALRAAAALRARAALEAAKAKKQRAEAGDGCEEVSAEDAMRGLMAEAQEAKAPAGQPNDITVAMVKAISKDDFEECETMIMQGADVNADCGAGMCALHITALRGEMFLTELVLAHGGDVNARDLSGNTPLLYACHFYRQNQRGVQMVSQLLYHGADPHFRVRDGKLAGQSAFDLMTTACNEPNMDENVPRQMRAMLQLAMDGSEGGREAITKMWMQFKADNKKLYQVSSKADSYGYAVESVAWQLPDNCKNAQPLTPVKLDRPTHSIAQDKFTELKNHIFNDEGAKVKVYVTFPETAAAHLAKKDALEVEFGMETIDVKLRGAPESFRFHIEPLFGTIDVDQCKYRVSESSRKVTLTLEKRHKGRKWSSLQKTR